MAEFRKRLTLSFDNGPDRDTTPQVLNELARRNLKATFFVLGKNLEDPELRALAARAHADGHWIGNHTYNHETPLGEQEDPDAALTEIGATQDLIGALSHPDKLFRPFGDGGNLDRRLLSGAAQDYLTANACTCVLWNSIPGDWEDPEGWVKRALDQTATHDWSVVVLHDLPTGAMDHLPEFLDQIAAKNIDIIQVFPQSCIAMRRGRSTRLLERIVAETPK